MLDNPPWLPLMASSSLVLISIAGLIMYFLFIAVVLKTKKLRDNSFYKLALSLGIADIIVLLHVIVYAGPCLYAQEVIG